ncbi:MAG: trigger factor [Rhodothermales bacterium]
MDVTINERSPVDFELDIRATNEELEPRLNEALNAQRKKMNLKGFRPGKVPVSIAKKMYGEAIAAQVAEEVIGEAYRDEVAGDESRDVLGQPRLVTLDYEMGSDLHAVVRFGIRPTVELADLSDVQVRKLVRDIADEDIEEEVQRRLRRQATLTPTETAATEDDVVIIDLQRVDKESNTPIVGERQEGQEVELDDERLRSELKDALLGKKAGDTFTVDLPHQHGPDEGHDHDDHVDRFLVTVQDVKQRELPAFDEEFVKEQSAGQVETVDAFRDMIRGEMKQAWERMSGEMMREEIVRELLEKHDFAVPETLIETVLDGMEEEVAKQNEGKLPAGFDRGGFRGANRENAETQVRWMLLKDVVMEQEDLDLTEEDFEAEFERMAENGPFDAATVKQFVAQQPQLLEGIQQRILNDKLFAALTSRFDVVETTQEEMEAARAAEEAAAEGEEA